LILNLLKNGQTTDFHRFSEKSMIYQEIQTSLQNEILSLERLRETLEKKRSSMAHLRTPLPACQRYLELETTLKNCVNKKRKEAEKEMQSIRDEYRFLQQDLLMVKECLELETSEKRSNDTVSYMENYIRDQTELVCQVLEEEGFIEKTCDQNYTLSMLGKIASNLAEVHPLVLTRFMVESNYFDGFSPMQLAGLFSCFTDVKVPEDERMSRPNIQDSRVKYAMESIVVLYDKYDQLELERDLRTGFQYQGALQFDLIELSMQWCRCSTESECKYFIQSAVAEKSISVGDFTKAMLKLVTVSREIGAIVEELGRIDLLYKLNEIEGLVLKYVATAQSLYV
jgi:superfamily II RNA helicase